MKKLTAGTVLLTTIATPAFAAEFYIVEDSGTKKCTIVHKRPTVTSTAVVGGDDVYTTVTTDGAMRAETPSAPRLRHACLMC